MHGVLNGVSHLFKMEKYHGKRGHGYKRGGVDCRVTCHFIDALERNMKNGEDQNSCTWSYETVGREDCKNKMEKGGHGSMLSTTLYGKSIKRNDLLSVTILPHAH